MTPSTPTAGAAVAPPRLRPAAERPAPALDRAPAREAVAVAVAGAAVYGLTLSAVPALSHDGPTYLLAIESGGDALYHPHHLAYNTVAHLWLDLWRAVGLGGDAVRTVEMLNALLGGIALGLVWTLLRRRAALPRPLAAAATAGAGLSYGVWFYSVAVEVCVLPLVLLLATLLTLTRPAPTVRTFVLAGLLNGLAVVGHQANVLFAAVVLAVALRQVDRRAVVERFGAYAASAAAVVVGVYAAVLSLAIRPSSAGEAADWFTRYAQSDDNWNFAPDAPLKAATGLGRSVVGGQFVFRFESARERLGSLLTGKSVADEAFLVRGLPPWLAVALVGLAAAGAVLLAGTLARGVARRRRLPGTARGLVRPLVVWLAVYSAFFLFWAPVNPEFWLPQTTLLWMLAALLCARAPGEPVDRRGAAVLGAAAVAIGIANLAGTMLPATDPGNDVYALRYATLGEAVGEGDVVVVDHPHMGLGYTARFTDAEAVPVSEFEYFVDVREPRAPTIGEIDAIVDRTLRTGGRVAIDADLIDEPSSGAAGGVGDHLADRYGDRWRELDVPGARGWYLVDG